MLMPRRTRTRVRRSLVSARAGAVSGRHFLLELAYVLGSFVMEEECVRGRWLPWRRRRQPAEEVAELLNTILDEAVADYGKDFEVMLVSSLACSRVEADPLRAAQPSWS